MRRVFQGLEIGFVAGTPARAARLPAVDRSGRPGSTGTTDRAVEVGDAVSALFSLILLALCGVAVENAAVTVDADIVLQPDEEYVLVPDTDRRASGGNPLRILEIEGRRITVEGGDLAQQTRVGAPFLVGPSYGTKWSEFRNLMDYAASRLAFYTVSDVLEGKHRHLSEGPP